MNFHSAKAFTLLAGIAAATLMAVAPAQAQESRRIPPDPNVSLQGFFCRNVNPYDEETTVICRGRANRNDVRYFYAYRGPGDELYYRDSITGQTLAAGSEGSNRVSPIPGIFQVNPGNGSGGTQIIPINPGSGSGSGGVQIIPNNPSNPGSGGGIQVVPVNPGSGTVSSPGAPGQGVIIIKP